MEVTACPPAVCGSAACGTATQRGIPRREGTETLIDATALTPRQMTSQTQKARTVRFHPRGTERWQVCGDRESAAGGDVDSLFADTASVWDGGDVLELFGADGCRTL